MEQFCIHFHEEKNGMTCNIALTALDYPSRSCVKNWNLGVDDGYLSSLLTYHTTHKTGIYVSENSISSKPLVIGFLLPVLTKPIL